ncbi:MAG TPA: LysR family transcriptional regulator [Caulobacteraceae bacterium]|nr:LysR family transcriptional regulator [Caulobacteraceae bacterium]
MPVIGALKLKAQIVCGDQFAMGPGKADVLDAIAREGSISAAGRSLGMSYRRTWLLVDTMNRCWSGPLVETTAGGGQSKGARLTVLGRDVLAAYRGLEARLAEASNSEALVALSAKLLPEPRPAQEHAPVDG